MLLQIRKQIYLAYKHVVRVIRGNLHISQSLFSKHATPQDFSSHCPPCTCKKARQATTENNVIEARRLSEGQQGRGWHCSSTFAESYQPPCSLAAPGSEERRTLYTLQHCLHAPGLHMQHTGMGRWSCLASTVRSRAITHTHTCPGRLAKTQCW